MLASEWAHKKVISNDILYMYYINSFNHKNTNMPSKISRNIGRTAPRGPGYVHGPATVRVSDSRIFAHELATGRNKRHWEHAEWLPKIHRSDQIIIKIRYLIKYDKCR